MLTCFLHGSRTLGMSRARKLKRSVSWRASVSMPWLDGTPPLSSAASRREVAQRPEYRHVIPRHPPLGDLGPLHAEDGAEIKPRPAPRRGERPHRSLLCAFVRGPDDDEI